MVLGEGIGGGDLKLAFLEFLLICYLHFSMKIGIEIRMVIKAVEQAVHQRGSSSSPHAGGSLISSKT